MICDAHTHLNDDKLFYDRPMYLYHFAQQGGKALINVATNLDSSQRALDIACQAEIQMPDIRVKASIGIHPSEAHVGNVVSVYNNINTTITIDQAINRLHEIYKKYTTYIVAIGECGIDMYYEGEIDILLQQQLFAAQCDMATELNLPLIIHSREAFDQTFQVLKNYPHLSIYFHCRGYNPEQIDKLLEHFPHLRIGLCGNVTYPKAQNLRDSLKIIPLDRLLIETDAPYLAPQVLRGTTNEPAYVSYIYEYIKDILSIDKQKLEQQIQENFDRLYRPKIV